MGSWNMAVATLEHGHKTLSHDHVVNLRSSAGLFLALDFFKWCLVQGKGRLYY